jgi:hypothetical protein
MLRPSFMIGFVSAGILPMVGLLLWARACFPKRSTEPAVQPPPDDRPDAAHVTTSLRWPNKPGAPLNATATCLS